MIEPKLSVESVINYAKESSAKMSKGGFLGHGKIPEKALAWEKILYPYYDVETEETINAVEKRGWFKKETVTKTLKSRISLDGITGAIIDVHDTGISYEYSFLKDLNVDELNLLHYISSVSYFTIQDLRGLGHSDAKARRLADGLAANGILRRTNSRPAKYISVHPYPKNPGSFTSIIEKYPLVESKTTDRMIDTVISSSSLSSYATRYWPRCNTIAFVLVYYPYYGITYERVDGRRTEIIDGITGTRQEYLERIISVQPQNKIEKRST